jgi:ribonuclease BN (tRNA processing enzyme)
VGRLLLTHVPPWVDAEAVAGAAADTFAGRLDLVQASAEFQI